MDIEYVTKGYCRFRLEDSLKLQTQNIPSGYGVYIFHRNVEDGDILYIGKSGTVLQNGCYKTQGLRDRLNNKQDGMKREEFLRMKMNEDNTIQKIFIEWYIIDERKYLPGLIEALLLQDYFKNTSPSTTLLYSAASRLPRNSFAESHKVCSMVFFATSFVFAFFAMVVYKSKTPSLSLRGRPKPIRQRRSFVCYLFLFFRSLAQLLFQSQR